MKPKPLDITKHYTQQAMARDLLDLTPIAATDSVLDAGGGRNKVWYNCLTNANKYECEIEDGNDFFQWTQPVDWIVGNPPFHISWRFTEHAIALATKGIAWLTNNTGLNSLLTPRRLQILQDAGFTVKNITVVSDKRWFGRYYYIIYTKENNQFVNWQRKTY